MPQMCLASLMLGLLEDGTEIQTMILFSWGPQKTHENKIIVWILKRVHFGLPYSSLKFSFWIPYWVCQNSGAWNDDPDVLLVLRECDWSHLELIWPNLPRPHYKFFVTDSVCFPCMRRCWGQSQVRGTALGEAGTVCCTPSTSPHILQRHNSARPEMITPTELTKRLSSDPCLSLFQVH